MRGWASTGPACGASYSSRRGDHWMCVEGSGLGCPLLQGKEGKGSGETIPPRSFPRLPGEAVALTAGGGCGAAGASHHVSQTGAGVVT